MLEAWHWRNVCVQDLDHKKDIFEILEKKKEFSRKKKKKRKRKKQIKEKQIQIQ